MKRDETGLVDNTKKKKRKYNTSTERLEKLKKENMNYIFLLLVLIVGCMIIIGMLSLFGNHHSHL